jgi:rsbT co-antagonist protein RsbR
MIVNGESRIPNLLEHHERELLDEWVQEQKAALPEREKGKENELRVLCGDFLGRLCKATQTNGLGDTSGPHWAEVRDLLADLSRTRSREGSSPSETATFVFSLKKPLFALLRRELARDPEALVRETWVSNELLDKLGLYTAEVFQKAREDVIQRQQQEMMELSTPVVKLWEGVLALPLIGTLDSARTQVAMENLLQRIVESSAEVAIIDITGVPAVDTQVAQHLIKTVTAARLMGTEGIISGIRPQIAQTIVHLGVDLGNISTKATLADAFALALKWRGLGVSRTPQAKYKGPTVERIPILQMGEFLLVSIQVDMHDRQAMTLQDDLTSRIAETGAHGVLIEISALDIVDSFIGRMIANISGMARVLDAETVVVGMQPAVAITLVELGLSLPGVRTALNVERGMKLLREAVRGMGADGRLVQEPAEGVDAGREA